MITGNSIVKKKVVLLCHLVRLCIACLAFTLSSLHLVSVIFALPSLYLTLLENVFTLAVLIVAVGLRTISEQNYALYNPPDHWSDIMTDKSNRHPVLLHNSL